MILRTFVTIWGGSQGIYAPDRLNATILICFFSVLNKIKVVLPAKPRLLYDNATIKPVLNYITAACLGRWSKDNLQSVLPLQKREARIILDSHRNILSFFSISNKLSAGSSILWGSESFKDKSLKKYFFKVSLNPVVPSIYATCFLCRKQRWRLVQLPIIRSA